MLTNSMKYCIINSFLFIVGKHKESCKKKQYVANNNNGAKTVDGAAGAFVALLKLYEHKGDGACGVKIWSPEVNEDIGGAANNHHYSSDEKNNVLGLCKFFHYCLSWPELLSLSTKISSSSFFMK